MIREMLLISFIKRSINKNHLAFNGIEMLRHFYQLLLIFHPRRSTMTREKIKQNAKWLNDSNPINQKRKYVFKWSHLALSSVVIEWTLIWVIFQFENKLRDETFNEGTAENKESNKTRNFRGFKDWGQNQFSWIFRSFKFTTSRNLRRKAKANNKHEKAFKTILDVIVGFILIVWWFCFIPQRYFFLNILIFTQLVRPRYTFKIISLTFKNWSHRSWHNFLFLNKT